VANVRGGGADGREVWYRLMLGAGARVSARAEVRAKVVAAPPARRPRAVREFEGGRGADTAQMAAVEVVRVSIFRNEVTAANVPELRELFGLERLPLAKSRVEIELKGVPTAVVNALRRVSLDEMPGHALQVPPDGFDTAQTSECFMLPQFVDQLRIALVPLRPQIPAEVAERLRLTLDVTNTGASATTVYSGDLEVAEGSMPEPLFNPTFELCTLQPGKRIVIRGIRVATGYGRDNAQFNVTRCAAFRHLDLPQHPEKETHEAGGAAVDQSGYMVSCLVADPRHHVLSAIVPATVANPAEARAVFVDACANIKDRLRLILSTVERRGALYRDATAESPEELAASLRALSIREGPSRGVQYTVVQLESGLSEGILQVPGETPTIGELLRRAVYELTPTISNITYDIVSHENRMILSLRHTEDVTKILLDAIRHGIATFDAIQRGIRDAR
jgi:hypothetical protein